MCIFSGPVRHVGTTRIFARLSGQGTQFLAYQMQFQADRPVAMILPLPVTFPPRDNLVRFIDLGDYPQFFDDLEKACTVSHGGMGGGGFGGGAPRSAPRLKVESVGDFDASFVPSIGDFGRLDPQFRLPGNVWQSLPQYARYGFAVFQLKPDAKLQAMHPMAFEFPTAARDRLFFPTVHLHDGRVHPQEDFDHTLYLQAARFDDGNGAWEKAARATSETVKLQKTQDMVTDAPLYSRELRGTLPNRDTVVRAG